MSKTKGDLRFIVLPLGVMIAWVLVCAFFRFAEGRPVPRPSPDPWSETHTAGAERSYKAYYFLNAGRDPVLVLMDDGRIILRGKVIATDAGLGKLIGKLYPDGGRKR